MIEYFANHYIWFFSSSMKSGIFQTEWKMANLVPIHKWDYRKSAKNCPPVSFLPIFWKIFKCLIFCTHYLLKTTSSLRINLVLSKVNLVLTLSRRRCLSYRNQSIDLKSKSMNWFLYDRDFRHKSVNQLLSMTHDIYHYLDGDYEVRGVFSDISSVW